MVAITATDRDARARSVPRRAGCGARSSWEEVEPEVRLYGNMAIVTYYFDMSFDMAGRTIAMGGRDMFVLVKENGRWWAVADRFSRFPGE